MLTGGCFCGQVRYETDGVPFHATICHCADCRRAAGAPVVAWFSVAVASFRIVTGAPKIFASSPGVMRGFCGDCGTALTYRQRDFPDEIDVTICSLDDPAAVAPRDHSWTSSRVSWVRFGDALPAYPATREER